MFKGRILLLFVITIFCGCSAFQTNVASEKVYLVNSHTGKSIPLSVREYDASSFRLGYASSAHRTDLTSEESIVFNGCVGKRKLIRFVNEKFKDDYFYIFVGITGKTRLMNNHCVEIINTIKVEHNSVKRLLGLSKTSPLKGYPHIQMKSGPISISSGRWGKGDSYIASHQGKSIIFSDVGSNNIGVSISAE